MSLCFYFIKCFLWIIYLSTILLSIRDNKRNSKVHENITCESAVNFYYWKTLSEAHKLITVWL